MSFGNIIVYLTIAVSCLSLFFILKSAKGDMFSYITSTRLYYLSGVLIGCSVLFMLSRFVLNDFSYLYVYNNSSVNLPIFYKISAMWAGQEGSFLIWLLILNIVGVFVVRSDVENGSILLSVIAITQIFILLCVVVKSPFTSIWASGDVQAGFVPSDGAGLNPLLQDPWMISHPPFLYLGYASAVIPFGYALAALLKNDYTILIGKMRKWAIFSFITLGIGIFMGGYWAYKVLGWGGYWGWDPVENSSLIPWFIVAVLIHGLVLQKRSSTMIKLNIFLSLIYFILVFYSTFLTRSGVLANFSVHSFGNEGISAFFVTLLSFIAVYVFIGGFLFIRQYKNIPSGNSESVSSQSKTTFYGMVVFMVFTGFVFVGTSMPILSGIFSENQIPVTESFYNTITGFFWPILILLMIFSTVPSVKEYLKDKVSIILLVLSLSIGIFWNMFFYDLMNLYNLLISIIVITVGSYLVFQSIYDIFKIRKTYILQSRIAHIGVGLLAIGIITSNVHSNVEQDRIFSNREKIVNSVPITLKGFEEKSPTQLTMWIKRGNLTEIVKTEYYFNQRTKAIYREPYVWSGFTGDIYIIPDSFESGFDKATYGIIRKGEEKEISGIKVKFLSFETKHMTSNVPTISAKLLVKNNVLAPSLVFKNGRRIPNELVIPGTTRKISLHTIDATNKSVWVHVTPDADTVIEPDSVIVNISKKRFIWLVWLGTLLIVIGGLLAFLKSRE